MGLVMTTIGWSKVPIIHKNIITQSVVRVIFGKARFVRGSLHLSSIG